MSGIRFNNRNPQFFNTLRVRVDQYFKDQELEKTGNFKLYSKTIILFATLIAFYITLVFFTPESLWISIPILILMGINKAAIGFNVMHDGAHNSYSNKPWINNLMGYSLNILGGNVEIWKQKHNINHHSFTNIEGMDDDIDIKPFIRTNTNQKRYKIHKFQHIYGLFLYGLTYISWVFYKDYDKYFRRRIADLTPIKKMSLNEHIAFWGFKALNIGVFIIVPGLIVGWVPTLIGYLIMAFFTGLVIAIVFQLAHLVEDTNFETAHKENARIETEWAVHQINTTANFATRSKSMAWLLGGLNFQIEHHLFPRISHVHYPKISKIVKETCAEYGINYRDYPTVVKAIKSHIMHLKMVGTYN